MVVLDPAAYDKAEAVFNVLSSVPERAKYDASINLSGKRKARVNLVPLGFYSCSLNAQQRNWPVWERELFAVLKSVEHFRAMVAGSTIVVHTDHINNTTEKTELSSPDKILRMLLKLDALAKLEWVYAPGRV